MAKTSEDSKRSALVFASSYASTVMVRGLRYISALELEEVIIARLLSISSINLKEILRN